MRTRCTLRTLLWLLAIWPGWVSAAAEGNNSAPFGLEWGMSSAQVKGLGVDLAERSEKDFGQTYSARKLPKVISDVSSVFLSFGYDDKLSRIAAISKDFDNDPYGAAVQSRYDELARVLGDKYGPGTQTHYQDPNLFAGPQDFLMGIHAGRTFRYTDFDSHLLHVQIGIGATDSSTGYYRIIFENKSLRTEFEKGKKAHKKGTL
jgi:hypothetical protein